MNILAHTGTGHGWGGPFEPWELHPVLNHLPIAFLLGGLALDLYAWWRGRQALLQVATGLLITGVLTGLLTALAGLLAFFTVPGHTEEAHRLMYWHMVVQATALLLFAGPTWQRWRNWTATPARAGRLMTCVAAVFLMIGSGIGGYLVFHSGVGVNAELLAPSPEHHEH